MGDDWATLTEIGRAIGRSKRTAGRRIEELKRRGHRIEPRQDFDDGRATHRYSPECVRLVLALEDELRQPKQTGADTEARTGATDAWRIDARTEAPGRTGARTGAETEATGALALVHLAQDAQVRLASEIENLRDDYRTERDRLLARIERLEADIAERDRRIAEVQDELAQLRSLPIVAEVAFAADVVGALRRWRG